MVRAADWSDERMEALKDLVRESDAREAFETLVSYGEEAAQFAVGPGGHGYVPDVRYGSLDGRTFPFAFIPNQKHLLFYIRTPALRTGLYSLDGLRDSFERIQARPADNEITIRIENRADAKAVILHVLQVWPLPPPRGVPEGITAEDVRNAAEAIRSGNAGAQYRDSTKWVVLVDGAPYSPKQVLGVAARSQLGIENPWDNFRGGPETNSVLIRLGFEVVPKDRGPSKYVLEDHAEEEIRRRRDLKGPATFERLIAARRGQGLYRQNLMEIEKTCRMTGLSDPQFLRASHIKPWSESSDEEKLDGNNGLLLSPHIDHLFDQGWISFADDGVLLLSRDLPPEVLAAWQLGGTPTPSPFRPEQTRYLAFHRQHVFRGH